MVNIKRFNCSCVRATSTFNVNGSYNDHKARCTKYETTPFIDVVNLTQATKIIHKWIRTGQYNILKNHREP
ncbi:hypothetical protein [Candidatus Enterovibrio escicola]|uniref:hypothetical protein n=1 Tax=Candidatus Enterovibrio escicola TaxID=1927127 RepID=UPI0030DB04C6